MSAIFQWRSTHRLGVGLAAVLLTIATATPTTCPCSNVSWCKPITNRPPVAEYEVLAFDPSASDPQQWLAMDWAKITTIATFSWPMSAQLYCHAHQHGVRIVHCVDFDASLIGNATARSAWVKGHLDDAMQRGTDGVNVDIEGFSGEKEDLNLLIGELHDTFKAALPSSQISFDTAIYPIGNGWDSGFDYPFLAKKLDFFLPMAYDMISWSNSQFANSPLHGIQSGIAQYRKLGIPMEQIVLGLPWYGYDFPCNSTVGSCHTTGGKQIEYWRAVDLKASSSQGGDLWQFDAPSSSTFFEYVNASGTRRQVWYDDAISLSIKYRWARAEGLRGVAMWTAGSLNATAQPEETANMWRAMGAFTDGPHY